jgi:hypothetical protein
MSSISIDASGTRGLTTTINEQYRTFASIPTKADDDLNVYVGNAGEISISIPATAPVKRLKKGDQEFLVVKLQTFAQLSCAHAENGTLHASISARKWKDGEGYLDDAELLDVKTLGELFEP